MPFCSQFNLCPFSAFVFVKWWPLERYKQFKTYTRILLLQYFDLFRKMDDEENFDDIEDTPENQEYDYAQNEYEDDNEYGGYESMQMTSRHSSQHKAHYLLCSSKRVLEQINEEIKEIMVLSCLDYNWSFLLYFISHWNKDIVYKLMDKESTHLKMISFVKDYQVETNGKEETCEVCLEDVPLLNNSCGHKYCVICWRGLLQTSVFHNSELFPRCQGEECEAKMNYKIIEIILNDPKNVEIKKKFEHLIFVLYSRQNTTVKMCPNANCGKLFLITDLRMKPIYCSCGTAVCTFCGNVYHSPIHCAELQNWEKMVSDNENKWIQIIQFKICPKCKDPIEKNQGCNHMTCRCRHEFCWICLQDWKTHGVCFGRDAHDRMEEERKKMLEDEGKYRQKFENSKAETGRFEAIIKRNLPINTLEMKDYLMDVLMIPTQQTEFLAEIPSLINLGFRFCWYCKIYEFFRDEQSLQSLHAETIESQCNILDDYMNTLVTEIGYLKKQCQNPEIYDGTKDHKGNIKRMIYDKRSQIVEKISQTKEFILKVVQEQ